MEGGEEYRRLRARKDQFAEAHAFHKDVVKGLHDASVKLLAGTDAGLFMPTILPGFSIHRELELLVECGLTPEAVLQAATAAPGTYLDPGSGRGQIRSGSPADLVLLDKNPLKSIGHTREIHAVVVRGKVLSRHDLGTMRRKISGRHQQARVFSDKLFGNDVRAVVEEVSKAASRGRAVPVLSEEGMLTAAYLFASRQEFEKAELLVRLSRELHPDSYLSALFHAGLFSMTDRSAEEQQALKDVLRLAPQHVQARLRLDSLSAKTPNR